MQTQLETLNIQLNQARKQHEQMQSASNGYLYGATISTNAQIDALIEQLTDLRQIKQQDLQKQISMLQHQLSLDGAINASSDGRVLDLFVQKGAFVQAGSAIGTVVRETQATENTSVMMYVPLEQGKQVREGMEVNVSPSTVKREEYGYIIGRVKNVTEYAVTQESMMATLQNQQLVQAFSGDSAVMAVEVELLRSPDTESGYLWSTPKGAPITIDAGTVCSAEIKVSSQRPADMVLPFIRKLFQGQSV
jgi:HlyD family secretion protein